MDYNQRVDQRLDEIKTIVDADFHLTEQPESFLPYLESPFRNRVSIDHHTHGLYPTPGERLKYHTEQRPVNSQEDIIEAMAKFGQDKVVITPTRNLYLGTIQNENLGVALANAYNEWVQKEIVDTDKGIYAAALAAPQKPEKAAEEIDDRASDPSIVSVFFPTGGITPLAGHQTYHPIYKAASDNRLPIQMHVASGNTLWAFPKVYQLMNKMAVHLTSHPMMMMTNLADMVTRGIFVRYPSLEVVLQEAGIGWVPYFQNRFDNEYHNKPENAPMLEKNPSEYIDAHCYFTSQPIEGAENPEYVNSMVRLCNGSENLIFSSDYPHFDFDNPDILMKLLTDFDHEEIEAIYGKTALEVFRF